jgi:hypothetical protein
VNMLFFPYTHGCHNNNQTRHRVSIVSIVKTPPYVLQCSLSCAPLATAIYLSSYPLSCFLGPAGTVETEAG